VTIRKTKAQLRNDLAETTRLNILDVATQEFADKGLAGARIDEIAEKTDSSKRMIYYYFGGKDGVYRAVLERAYAGIREREVAQNFDAMPAEAAMRSLVEHTFDYHDRHPEFVRLVMNENMLHGVHVAEIAGLKERNRRVVETIAAILDRGVAEAVFREGVDPLALHLTMSAMSFYCVSNRYTIRAGFGLDLSGKKQKAARREQIVETVLASVRAKT
jgi:AcrR family transcriptional regulator